MNTTLTPSLFRDFIEELMGHHDTIELKRETLVLVAQVMLDREQFHLEGRFVWRLKAWKTSQDAIAKRKAASEWYNNILFEHKEALEKLIAGLMGQLLIDREQAFVVALKIKQNKNVQAANLFGVDISDLPEIPKDHWIIDQEGTYKL